MGFMSDPRAPQRREPLHVAFEPIPDRMARKFPQRVANGDRLPIWGMVQTLPDGSVGGTPVPWFRNMNPIANTPMNRKPAQTAKIERKFAERVVKATRFLEKPRITFAVSRERYPRALDAAKSLKMRPPNPFMGKPAPPAPFQGGFTRVFDRDHNHPKNTGVSMKPLRPAWGVTPSSNLSETSSAIARSPKTL